MNTFRIAGGMLCLPLMLAGCGGDDDPAPAAVAPMTAEQACVALRGLAIPATAIGLPSRGAKVVTADLQAPAGTGVAATPEHCKVIVHVESVDPTAPGVTAQVNLPTTWNRKAVQYGGGGLNGVVVTATTDAPGAPAQPVPLATGYATFGSDGGHQVANAADSEGQARAFLNDDVAANYGYASVKRTRDVALGLIKARYGAAPQRVYFAGRSGGGREALAAVQKFPDDYDGVIALYPAGGGVARMMAWGQLSRALAAPGAYPNPAKRAVLHDAVVAACDALDGAADGIVSNPAACRFDVQALRCPGGADQGDMCLSDPQIAALDTIAADFTLPYALASKETGYPGLGIYRSGIQLNSPGSGMGTAAPITKRPAIGVHPGWNWLFDPIFRGTFAQNVDADSLAFDPKSPGGVIDRLNVWSTEFFVADPNLSRFLQRGGKLILAHGKDDELVAPRWTENYYHSVVATMGADAVNRFIRYFEVPGYGHGGGDFKMDWNSLAALDDWVEKGIAPDQPIATDVNTATAGRTRPLCQYPLWPRYAGSGDIHRAASFTCVRS